MNAFTEVLTRMTPPSENLPEVKILRNYAEYLQWQCGMMNKTKGEMNDGFDCPDCLNRGYISVIRDDFISQRECACMSKRKGFLRLKKSGFGELAKRCTFDSYRTPEEWQRRAKAKAMEYVREKPEKWLFFGGQSGCGKTHLCTAVCMELMNQGFDLKYVMWRDMVHLLEANRFENAKYSGIMQEIQSIDVLYLDDFLKTTRRDNAGKLSPSENELNMAYEIINLRIISGNKTIISSELQISDISALDEATGGRISEKSKGWQILIKYEKSRNFRFHGEVK
ncbi:MAG: ATP-binding protein [Ruminococcus flavefaciens]|nr:ATP-binding protein [Ruminococcus flavefaciens]